MPSQAVYDMMINNDSLRPFPRPSSHFKGLDYAGLNPLLIRSGRTYEKTRDTRKRSRVKVLDMVYEFHSISAPKGV